MVVFASKVVLLLLPIFFSHGNGQLLPTLDEFLSTLFNVSINDVGAVANNFTFINVSSSNIHFLLYQSDNEIVTITAQNATNFVNSSYPTIIFIHGWNSNATNEALHQFASLYHQKGDYNVIAVDWSYYALQNYVYAASTVQYVGYVVGGFLLDIVQEISNFLETVHIIGHSLGAHVSGFAGKLIQDSELLVPRITGLDAAGPLFETPVPRPPTLRLANTDADFVDLIHTDAGLAGVILPYGDVDFYPNDGGPLQPNCPLNLTDTLQAIICSHNDAITYYSQTILDSDIYIGVFCTDALSFGLGLCNANQKAVMGDAVSRNASGTFYLVIITTDVSP